MGLDVGSRRCAISGRHVRGGPGGLGQDAAQSNYKEFAVSFAIYMVGFLIFLGGLIWAAVTAHVPHVYIAIGAVILLGIGIFSAVGRTRSKDPSQ